MVVVRIVREWFVSDIFDFLRTFGLEQRFLEDEGLESLDDWDFPVPDEEIILRYLDEKPEKFVVFFDEHDEGDFWIAQIEVEP